MALLLKSGKSTEERFMGKTVNLEVLPNHINGEHRGYGLIGKTSTVVDKAEESHSYFY